MNRHQAKGGVKSAVGKAQEHAGRMMGSEKHQAKGLAKQAAGKTQKAYGDGKEAVKKSTRRRTVEH